jgi:hypothetical protein
LSGRPYLTSRSSLFVSSRTLQCTAVRGPGLNPYRFPEDHKREACDFVESHAWRDLVTHAQRALFDWISVAPWRRFFPRVILGGARSRRDVFRHPAQPRRTLSATTLLIVGLGPASRLVASRKLWQPAPA